MLIPIKNLNMSLDRLDSENSPLGSCKSMTNMVYTMDDKITRRNPLDLTKLNIGTQYGDDSKSFPILTKDGKRGVIVLSMESSFNPETEFYDHSKYLDAVVEGSNETTNMFLGSTSNPVQNFQGIKDYELTKIQDNRWLLYRKGIYSLSRSMSDVVYYQNYRDFDIGIYFINNLKTDSTYTWGVRGRIVKPFTISYSEYNSSGVLVNSFQVDFGITDWFYADGSVSGSTYNTGNRFNFGGYSSSLAAGLLSNATTSSNGLGGLVIMNRYLDMFTNPIEYQNGFLSLIRIPMNSEDSSTGNRISARITGEDGSEFEQGSIEWNVVPSVNVPLNTKSALASDFTWIGSSVISLDVLPKLANIKLSEAGWSYPVNPKNGNLFFNVLVDPSQQFTNEHYYMEWSQESQAWVEAVYPNNDHYSIDGLDRLVEIRWDSNRGFSFESVEMDRLSGDLTTNPLPKFIGSKLIDVKPVQGRAMFVSESGVEFSGLKSSVDLQRNKTSVWLDQDYFYAEMDDINPVHSACIYSSGISISGKGGVRILGSNGSLKFDSLSVLTTLETYLLGTKVFAVDKYLVAIGERGGSWQGEVLMVGPNGYLLRVPFDTQSASVVKNGIDRIEETSVGNIMWSSGHMYNFTINSVNDKDIKVAISEITLPFEYKTFSDGLFTHEWTGAFGDKNISVSGFGHKGNIVADCISSIKSIPELDVSNKSWIAYSLNKGFLETTRDQSVIDEWLINREVFECYNFESNMEVLLPQAWYLMKISDGLKKSRITCKRSEMTMQLESNCYAYLKKSGRQLNEMHYKHSSLSNVNSVFSNTLPIQKRFNYYLGIDSYDAVLGFKSDLLYDFGILSIEFII